jgi:putative ABC transport system permease protein
MIGIGRARLRSSLTAAGIAIGCGALVSMVAFALGLQTQMEAPFKQLGLINDIHVTAVERREDSQAKNSSEAKSDAADKSEPSEKPAEPEKPEKPETPKDSPPLDDAALAAFRKIPNVKYAYPEMRMANVRIQNGEHSEECSAIAAPREAGLTSQATELLSAGRYFSLDDAPEAILNVQLAQRLGFSQAADAVGAEVDVSSAGIVAQAEAGDFRVERQSLKVKIVGVFQPPQFGPSRFGGGPLLALMPVDVLQQLPTMGESQLEDLRRGGRGAGGTYRRAIVRAESMLAVEDVAAAIRSQGFEAQTMISRLDQARTAFLFIKSLLSAVGSVAMVIAGLGIANTLLMTVLERYQEIGLYKAIGATDGDVRQLFLFEAAALGLLGGLAGLLLASVVCWGLQWGVSYFLSRQGVSQPPDVFAFPLWLLSSGVAFSVAISVLSGIYPASRAARIEPIDALRGS